MRSLGDEVGVNRKSIDRWISVLEADYIVFLLRPYHENYHKRLVKTPKLYFWDTRLACSLLRIRSAQELDSHYLRGGLFENLMIVEEHKERLNQGVRPLFCFWRDSSGLENDLLSEDSRGFLEITEIKSSQTISTDMFAGLEKFHTISGKMRVQSRRLLYAGSDHYVRKNIHVQGWGL